MSATKRDVLILVVVAVFLGAMAYFAFPSLQDQPRSGPAGRSGSAPGSDRGQEPRRAPPEKVDQAINIIQDRVNKLGVAEPEIQRQGEWRISIQLPGIENQEQALADNRQDRAAGVLRCRGLRHRVRDGSRGSAPRWVRLRGGFAGWDQTRVLAQGRERCGRPYYLVTVEPPVTGAMLNSDGIRGHLRAERLLESGHGVQRRRGATAFESHHRGTGRHRADNR